MRRHGSIANPPRLLTGLMTALLACAAQSAHADQADLCVDRPGIGTPPCTLASGEAMLEMTAGGWEYTRDAQAVTDDITLGDALLRVGVAEGTEVQLGLTSHVIHHERDRMTGERERNHGAGDATIAMRHNFGGGDGPIALQAFVTLPVGEPPLGEGRVSAGVLLPVEIKLPADFELALTPEADLTPDEESRGHHLTWGGVVGLSHPLGKALQVSAELAAFRDEESGDTSTDARVTGSLAWRAGRRLQLDVEVDAGISDGAPDRAVVVGFARQFR